MLLSSHGGTGCDFAKSSVFYSQPVCFSFKIREMHSSPWLSTFLHWIEILMKPNQFRIYYSCHVLFFLFCFCLLSSSTGHLKRRHFCLGPPEDCCKVLFENLVTKAKPALLTVDCRVLHADCLRAQVKKLNRRVIQPMPPSRSFLCSRKSGLSSVPHVDDSMISRTVSVIDIEEKKWNLTCSQ